MTIRIPLTQGRFALIDDGDVELVSKNKWYFDGRYDYKGIAPWGNKWRAMLAKKYIGLFNTPEEAAAAYDKAAKERFGEHAGTNF